MSILPQPAGDRFEKEDMENEVNYQDKILGAIYGLMISKSLSRQLIDSFVGYIKYTRLNTDIFSDSDSYEFMQIFDYILQNKGNITYDCIEKIARTKAKGVAFSGCNNMHTPLSALISNILYTPVSFRLILDQIAVYSLLGAKKDLKKVFSDITLLVSSVQFSDELSYASYSLYLILNELIHGTFDDKDESLGRIKEIVFKELNGFTTHNALFYTELADRELYKIHDGSAWNSMLLAFNVLKRSSDYIEGVRKIFLIGGDVEMNLKVFSVLFGSFYGASGMPKEYVENINKNIPQIVNLKNYISPNLPS